VIEAEYRSPYVAHAPLEPLNAIVLVDRERRRGLDRPPDPAPGSGRGGPDHRTRRRTGDVPQPVHRRQLRPPAGVRAHQTGDRDRQPMRGTPVKLTYSREEDFAQDFPRHIAMGRARGVSKTDRSPRSTSTSQRLGHRIPGQPHRHVGSRTGFADRGGRLEQPLCLADFRMRAFRAEGLAPTSSWRAVGAPGAGFIFDTFLDELIHAAGADPMAERIRLMDHDVSRRVLETAARSRTGARRSRPTRARASPSSKASASRWPRSCRSPTRTGHPDRQGLGRLRRRHHR
jgi:isoquinoline 1-oxidoreductase beta subunit